MTEMACRSFMMPELTKPTAITEVAAEDWITAVTPVPKRTPFSCVPETLNRIGSSLSPETFFRPSPIRDMPNRKRATPLNSEIISGIPICTFLPVYEIVPI